jgi:hypothetical protein
VEEIESEDKASAKGSDSSALCHPSPVVPPNMLSKTMAVMIAPRISGVRLQISYPRHDQKITGDLVNLPQLQWLPTAGLLRHKCDR